MSWQLHEVHAVSCCTPTCTCTHTALQAGHNIALQARHNIRLHETQEIVVAHQKTVRRPLEQHALNYCI
jgi:hypothetical protein